MCGIIGMIDAKPVALPLLSALRRLEYRGYDSAGMATLNGGRIERRRSEGKIARLEQALKADPLHGTTGIGHTRWATHGAPVEKNAHPHANGVLAVVHNGIIENFASLRQELEGEGRRFESETDSEVIVHLLTREVERCNGDLALACREVLPRLKGMFALVAMFADEEGVLFGARCGSPLALGFSDGDKEGESVAYFGSDALSLSGLAERIVYLNDGEWALLRADAKLSQLFGADNKPRPLAPQPMPVAAVALGKGNHRHFMEKEIVEQPSVWGDVLSARLDSATRRPRLPALPFAFSALRTLHITACGTAYYAALVAKYWLEAFAGISVEVDVASELRYRSPVLRCGEQAAMCISQSGETMDSLEALRLYQEAGLKTIALVNVEQSSIARLCDVVLPTHAGPEIGVASTKAFTTQLLTLACFTLTAANERGMLSHEKTANFVEALTCLPGLAARCLEGFGAGDSRFAQAAQILAHARDALYLGRGVSYPIALEGALKIKEISYIHAEGYAAGEMKHGPIALVDDAVPIVAIAPYDRWFAKTLSNVHEVASRGARVILLSSARGIAAAREGGVSLAATVELPECLDEEAVEKEAAANKAGASIGEASVGEGSVGRSVGWSVMEMMHPILYSLPVQILAHDVALLKGTDVDQPRNLAKSVTVE